MTLQMAILLKQKKAHIMNKALALKLHRWVTLVFALPLLVLIVTGLVLSIEPIMLQKSSENDVLTLAKLQQIQKEFDSDKKARSFSFRSYTNEVTLSGVGEEGEILIDAESLAEKDEEGLGYAIFSTSKRLHEHFLYELTWAVHTSTYAMLVLVALGLWMGLPRLRYTLGGWHKMLAWGLLPLIILSPLSGVLLGNRITFATGGMKVEGKPLSLWEAVEKVSLSHPPSNIVWVRPQGGAIAARVMVEGQSKVYRVTDAGLFETPKNWVRLIHEGTWSAGIGGFLNAITSLVLMFLAGSGLFIWGRRKVMAWKRSRSI